MFIAVNDFILDLNGIIEQVIKRARIKFKRLMFWVFARLIKLLRWVLLPIESDGPWPSWRSDHWLSTEPRYAPPADPIVINSVTKPITMLYASQTDGRHKQVRGGLLLQTKLGDHRAWDDMKAVESGVVSW